MAIWNNGTLQGGFLRNLSETAYFSFKEPAALQKWASFFAFSD